MSEKNKPRKINDDGHKEAIDYMTERIKDHNERQGKETTDAEARKRAVEIAHLVVRKDNK